MAAGEAGNTRLRSARQALGLRSQQQLADAITRAGAQIGLRISVTERTVRRWESDGPPWPSPEHQSAIESLFGRPITELGFTPPWIDDDADYAGRAPASPAVIASTVASAHAAFPNRVLADPLPGSTVTDYLTITSAYRHMYWTVPTSQLHGPVASHVKLGVTLIASIPEASRRSLAAAISESSLLTGRIEFFDMQSPQQAQDSFVTALQAAQDAHDSLLGSAALAHMVFIPAFSGDSRRAGEARDKMRAAREFARRGSASPEMRAWLDAVEAEAETRFGDTRKALQLISHAEEIYAREEPRPSPPWLDWFSPVRLAGFKGNTLLAAHQPGQARETLQHVLDNLPEDAIKQRSVILGDLAAVAISEGKAEEACRLAEMALEQLSRTWYATGMDRVRAVRESLAQWESLPAVRRLDEKLYDWNTTLNALTSG
jgi:transcriptional regulator with XRE-family HTH domain/tetratricopeptide (TPR) repeat protein